MLTADSSVKMETLLDNAEASLRWNRFNPLRLTGDLTTRVPGRDGLKGVRVGEASNQGPPIATEDVRGPHSGRQC